MKYEHNAQRHGGVRFLGDVQRELFYEVRGGGPNVRAATWRSAMELVAAREAQSRKVTVHDQDGHEVYCSKVP